MCKSISYSLSQVIPSDDLQTTYPVSMSYAGPEVLLFIIEFLELSINNPRSELLSYLHIICVDKNELSSITVPSLHLGVYLVQLIPSVEYA